MNILVLNCGSSTVKFQIIQTDPEIIKNNAERCLASGNLEKLGSQEALVTLKAVGSEPYKDVRPLADHREAVNVVLQWIASGKANIEGVNSLKDIHAVGHRVLHGGERCIESCLVTDEVMQVIEECAVMGPLHNMANLRGMQACRELLGENVPQVAVFDTAYHHTMEPKAFMYALPYELYEKHNIRRYGFHGTSHRFIALKYAEVTGTPIDKVNIVSLHLGNGCSLCAIQGGKCVDTTMGMTPLEGLMMGTRCGDIDPSIVPFICGRTGMDVKDTDTLMNKKSGLLGIAGMSDMRDLENAAVNEKNERAQLALDMFVHRVKKYLGAFLFEMGGADALVFTGGIGQNSDYVRREVCKGLEKFGIIFDEEKNQKVSRSTGGILSADNSAIKVWTLPTNEELMIARDTVALTCK
ncbi:MAG: acetate kinase [bacterium]|nr:acetate kinase [bacterium]